MRLLLHSFLLLFSGMSLQTQTITKTWETNLITQNFAGICSAPNSVNLAYSKNSVNNLQNLGIVKICDNYPQGFKLFVSSDNGGELRNQGDARYQFIYQINGTTAGAVGGGDGLDIAAQGNGGTIEPAFQPRTSPTLVYTSPNGANCTRGQRNGCDVGLQWQVISTDPMPEGSYSDTLRFTITAN